MRLRTLAVHALALLTSAFWRVAALASETGGSLPWNDPIDRIRENITGPTMTAIIIMALALGFAMWTLSDDNRGLYRALKAVIAMAVVSTIGVFFGSLGISAAVL